MPSEGLQRLIDVPAICRYPRPMFGSKDKKPKAKVVATLDQYILKDDNTLQIGMKKWDVTGATADFEHGANVGGRVTATRVALTGVFALALKKDRNKVYIPIEFADGEQHLIEARAKNEAKAREFARQLQAAAGSPAT